MADETSTSVGRACSASASAALTPSVALLATAGPRIGIRRCQPDDDIAVAGQALDQSGAAVQPLASTPSRRPSEPSLTHTVVLSSPSDGHRRRTLAPATAVGSPHGRRIRQSTTRSRKPPMFGDPGPGTCPGRVRSTGMRPGSSPPSAASGGAGRGQHRSRRVRIKLGELWRRSPRLHVRDLTGFDGPIAGGRSDHVGCVGPSARSTRTARLFTELADTRSANRWLPSDGRRRGLRTATR